MAAANNPNDPRLFFHAFSTFPVLVLYSDGCNLVIVNVLCQNAFNIYALYCIDNLSFSDLRICIYFCND